jgi:hypothetical protein
MHWINSSRCEHKPAAVVIDDDVAVVISDDEVVSVAVAAPVAPRPPAISCKDPVAGLSKDELEKKNHRKIKKKPRKKCF